MIPAGHRNVADEHGAGMFVKERAQSRQNRLDPFLGHDGENDHLAAGVVEQQVTFMESVMPLAGNIVDDRIAGSADSIEQIRH